MKLQSLNKLHFFFQTAIFVNILEDMMSPILKMNFSVKRKKKSSGPVALSSYLLSASGTILHGQRA